MLLKNGNLWMPSGCFEQQDLRIAEGKIKEINKNLEPLENEETVDLKGLNVYPGMVEAHCHLGLCNSSIGYEGQDFNETAGPVAPELRAMDSINVLDESVSQARKAGVTTVASGPGSANVVGGTFACWKTAGNCIDDMLVDKDIAMKAAFGENPKRFYQRRNVNTRMQEAALIRSLLYKTTDYMEKKKAAKDGLFGLDSSKLPPFDLQLEAMIPVLERKIPLKCHAHQHNDIMTVIRLAKEFNIKVTLDHCTDGELVIEEIRRSGWPAILGPALSHKSKPELANLNFSSPKAFQDAGILFSITTDSPVIPLEYLPVAASLAMKSGLSEAQAIDAITISPARILGIDKRVGSLEAGKDADLIICSGSLLDIQHHVFAVYVNGQLIPEYE
ncbi:MAG: amidohydrolase [Erysipelotrichaceae bacterium]|nr:amidohydrolase [Erysipelotrichaceae bacterium]